MSAEIQYYLQGTNEKCNVCKMKATKEGYDPCLGELPTNIVMNACCGHEDVNSAYIQFIDGQIIRGEIAKFTQSLLVYITSQQSEKEKELYQALDDLMIEVNNDWVTVETANKVEKTLEKYKPKG